MDPSKNRGQDLNGFGPGGFPSTIRPSLGNDVGQLFDYGFNDKSDQLDNDFMDKFNLVAIDDGLLRSLDDQQDDIPPQTNGMSYGQPFSQNFLQGGFPLWGGLPSPSNLMTPAGNDEAAAPFFLNNQVEEDSSRFMDRFGFGFSPLISSFPGPMASTSQSSLAGQQLTPQQQLHAETATPQLEKQNVQQKQPIKDKANPQQQPASLNSSQNVQEHTPLQSSDENVDDNLNESQDDKRSRQKVKQPQKKEETKQTDKRGKKIKMSFHEFCSMVGVNNDSAPATAPSTDDDEEATRSLWIGNIGSAVSEKDLLDEFSAFGEVESIRILHQSFCAFVNFKTVECAVAAKKGLQGQIFDSQYIVINYRKANGDRQEALPVKPVADHLLNKPSRALWVCNISDSIREEDLINEFEKYGEVESIRLIRNKSCAFVNFVSVERATEALHGLQSKVLGGLSIKINFAKTQPPAVKGREEGPSPTPTSPSPIPAVSSPPVSPGSTSPATPLLPSQPSPPSTAKPPSTQQQQQPPSPPSEFPQFPPQQMNNNTFNQTHLPPTLSPFDNYAAYFGGVYNNFNYPYPYPMINLAAIDYNQLTCHLCFQALKDTLFVPCNHVSCSKCVIKLRTATVYKKDKGTKCPFCDTIVQKFVPLNYAEALMMQATMQQIPPQQMMPQPSPSSSPTPPSHYPQQQQHMQAPSIPTGFQMHAPSEHSYRVK